ncbi:MAG: WD40 repeat domain-containing protein [Myxococcales bacterium]|nr:WD40 repeat domain-containing protein [Myxococcales bacterium]
MPHRAIARRALARVLPLVVAGLALAACAPAPARRQEPTVTAPPIAQIPAQTATPGVEDERPADDTPRTLTPVARYGGTRWVASSEVKAVALSSDGRWAVSGGGDGPTPLLWDAQTGELAGPLGGATLSVAALAFTPDSRLVAGADIGRSIVVWDVATRAVVRRLEGHTASVYRLAISPDGKLLASGDADGVVLLWDLGSSAAPRTLARDLPSTGALGFSPDSRTLAVPNDGGIVTLWDLASGRMTRQSPAPSGRVRAVHGLCYSHDGTKLVTGETLGDGTQAVVVRDAASLRVLRTLLGHDNYAYGLATTPDDRLLVSAGGDGQVHVWELATGRELHAPSHAGVPLWTLGLSPDGRLAVAAGGGRKIHLFRVDTGEAAVPQADHEAAIAELAFAPDGRTLASGDDDGVVIVRDLASGTVRHRLPKQARALAALAWSADGSRLFTLANGDGRYWNAQTGAPLGSLQLGRFDGAVLSPDGRFLAASSSTRIVRLLDAATGTVIRTFGEAQPHDDIRQNLMTPSAVSFSPDGKALAVARWDQPTQVWEIATGAPLRTLAGTLHVAFSPRGDLLAGSVGSVSKGGRDLRTRLWRAATGAELFTFAGETAPVFTPDGRHVLVLHDPEAAAPSGSTPARERELLVWSAATGRLVARAPVPRHDALAASPHGTLVALGSRDGTVVVFDLAPPGR